MAITCERSEKHRVRSILKLEAHGISNAEKFSELRRLDIMYKVLESIYSKF